MTIDYSMGVTNQLNKPAEPHIFTHGEFSKKLLYVSTFVCMRLSMQTITIHVRSLSYSIC